MVFTGAGQTEFCPDYGIYDIKTQKLLKDGAGDHEQSYAFYSSGNEEKYVIRFSAWSDSGEPIVIKVGDRVTVTDVDTGESMDIKDGLNGSVTRLEVRKDALVGVSALGEDVVITSNISQYLP